jgi:hypothetical protein
MRKFVQIVQPMNEWLERLLECPLAVTATKKEILPAVASKGRNL